MALPRTLTVADLYAIPESERGERYELIDGELYVNPAPTPAHQIISGNLMLNLELRVRANRVGRVIAATVSASMNARMLCQTSCLSPGHALGSSVLPT